MIIVEKVLRRPATCVCACACACACACVCARVRVCVRVCVSMLVCVHVLLSLCVCVCARAWPADSRATAGKLIIFGKVRRTAAGARTRLSPPEQVGRHA